MVPRSGLGDVLGVDPKLRRLFSQRQAAIEEYSDRRGTGPPGRNRTRGAFYATREEKDRTRSVGSLIDEWRGRASDFGFDLGDLSKVVGLGRARAPVGEIDPARVRQHLEDLPDRCRSLARRDLVAIVAVAAPGGSSARAIESIATRVMESAGAPLGAEYSVNGSRGSSETAAGQSVSLLEPRWSTEEVVRAMGRGADRLLNPVDAEHGLLPTSPGQENVAEKSASGWFPASGRSESTGGQSIWDWGAERLGRSRLNQLDQRPSSWLSIRSRRSPGGNRDPGLPPISLLRSGPVPHSVRHGSRA